MLERLFVVSDCCPVGCSTPVVVLRALDSSRLFAYCDGCGCTFDTPEAAQFVAGLNAIHSLFERAPRGVALPSTAELGASEFESVASRTISTAIWGTSLAELNSDLEQQRLERDRGPG